MTEHCALFFATDCAPRFGMELCTKESLAETIRKNLWGSNLSDDDHATIKEWSDALIEEGKIDFEDGWLGLFVGIEAITAELMRRCVEQYEETQYECRGAAEYGAAKVRAEERYNRLRDALRDALGDKGPEVAAKAA